LDKDERHFLYAEILKESLPQIAQLSASQVDEAGMPSIWQVTPFQHPRLYLLARQAILSCASSEIGNWGEAIYTTAGLFVSLTAQRQKGADSLKY